jgi:hypothetical protein
VNVSARPAAFWIIVIFLAYYLVFLLAGQTASVFAYDFTVRMGLQESAKAVGEYGVQVNRALGLADTVVLIPLIIISLIGLFLRKTWALTTLAAVMGITLYWPICCSGLLFFLEGVPGFSLEPGMGYWLVFAVHTGFALGTLFCILLRGQTLFGR